MQPIEDLVRELLDDLDGNTYLFFTSDNGYHLGPRPGKATPADTDTRVPLSVVGPGVVEGADEHFALNIDLAPTIAELAGVTPPTPVDGVSLVPLLCSLDPPWRQEFTIELLAFTAFPTTHWKKIWSTNPVRHEAPCDRAEMEGLRLRVVAAA